MRVWMFVCAIALMSSGCLTFSSLQSAPIVPQGVQASTIAISRMEAQGSSFSRQGSRYDYAWTNFEFRGRMGTSKERLDLGMRVALSVAERDVLGTSLGLDARIGIVSQLLTVQLPATVVLSDYGDSRVELHPTLVGTYPIAPRWELNGSWTYHVETSEGETAISASVGLRVPTPIPKLSLRPEVAWFQPSTEWWGPNPQRQLSLGLELRSLVPVPGESEPGDIWR